MNLKKCRGPIWVSYQLRDYEHENLKEGKKCEHRCNTDMILSSLALPCSRVHLAHDRV